MENVKNLTEAEEKEKFDYRVDLTGEPIYVKKDGKLYRWNRNIIPSLESTKYIKEDEIVDLPVVKSKNLLQEGYMKRFANYVGIYKEY